MSEYGPDTPVPIYQHEAEFSALLAIYRERRPKRVLEIGSYHGGTLYHWLRNAKPGTLVVSVDTYTAADNRYIYPDWVPEGVRLEVFAADSRDPATVARVNELGPFDWIFIDADHWYDAVKEDWENYGIMCSPCGIVALHDILDDRKHHPEIEVARLWAQIREGGYPTREIIHDPNAWWGGIGVVYR
jgi:predicted O-methyltransferase YrrM